MMTFGPVPSRRLGRSLGINNIPPKNCTYSCVYCQAGRTSHLQAERRAFYEPEEIVAEVAARLGKIRESGESVDYLTFVPDGEPTLDINLGRTIDMLKPLGIRVAVITNGSLLWHEDAASELGKSDLVSIKVDAVGVSTWRRIDRPHGLLRLPVVMAGILGFSRLFNGDLMTETMLIHGVNDNAATIERTAEFLAQLTPKTAYIAVPTRPPAETWVKPPDEKVLNNAWQIFGSRINHVEFLIDYEGDSFSGTGETGRDLLSILAVHPMRVEAVERFLKDNGRDWELVRRLIAEGSLAETEYLGRKFYVRRFRAKP